MKIKNIKNYNKKLANGMDDKIWFATQIPANEINTIVDYGCADGTLISYVHDMMPGINYIGVDCSEEMLALAREKCPYASFLTNKQYLNADIDTANAAIVASSVIHEIFSYSENLDEEIGSIFNRDYKYIAVRDMFLGTNSNRCSDECSIQKIREKYDALMLHQFETLWGCINRMDVMIHFLMKYRYKENWEREVHENYFPITVNQLVYNMVPNTYCIEYKDHYVLPFLKEQIKSDFDILLKDPTHLKVLFKKIEE